MTPRRSPGATSRQASGATRQTSADAGLPTVAVVVVDHDAGPVLTTCLESVLGEAVDEVVVVDNGGRIGSSASVAGVDRAGVDRAGVDRAGERAVPVPVPVQVLPTGTNLGYGAGGNRGVAATAAEVVVVTNPDVVMHPGAVAALVDAVVADPTVAVVGPRILEADGRRYPSARRFPAPLDALGHAALGRWWPENRFSRRYRMEDLDPASSAAVDWVSGACLAVRRRAWEEIGGFDESYFMYAEDMDLCYRARQAGWSVRYEPAATVTHLQGVTTRHRPYAMAVAHHRSALRFAWRTNQGWYRLLVPGAAVLLGARLAAEMARVAWKVPPSEPDLVPGWTAPDDRSAPAVSSAGRSHRLGWPTDHG